MSKRIRSGDKVELIAGNDKGKVGKILSRLQERVIVEGVNVRKKHAKRTQNAPGNIIEKEMPVHISNVRLVKEEGKKSKAAKK